MSHMTRQGRIIDVKVGGSVSAAKISAELKVSAQSFKEEISGKPTSSAALNASKTASIDLSGLTGEPTYTFVLVDKSGSMEAYTDKVIEGYKIMIDNFRASQSTVRGTHFITLALFNETYDVVQEAASLSPMAGGDQIETLSRVNYQPEGATALYDSLYDALDAILQLLTRIKEAGTFPKLNIAIISDGEDNRSKRDTTVLRGMVRQLIEAEYLKSSVVLGLLSDRFSADMLENIRAAIGFEKIVKLDKNNSREMRRAFKEASKIT